MRQRDSVPMYVNNVVLAKFSDVTRARCFELLFLVPQLSIDSLN